MWPGLPIWWAASPFRSVSSVEESRAVEAYPEYPSVPEVTVALDFPEPESAFDLGTAGKINKTCSIGFASLPFSIHTLEDPDWEGIVKIADRALYAAKRSGRNAWVGLVPGPEHTDADELLPAATDPGILVEQGILNVQTSLEHTDQLVWE